MARPQGGRQAELVQLASQPQTLESVSDLAGQLGLLPEELQPYGHRAAKIELTALERLSDAPDGRLVSVTAVTPTKAGEGKTTTAISLTEALGWIGERPVLCLREPSLGPVFGIKGGGTGGGLAQLAAMDLINLHFTGDIHAIGAANNLLAAMLEAHLLHGNALGIDPHSITWRRCVDMDDRALRRVVVGLGGRTNGTPRETGFDITAASEVMAIVAVSSGYADLRRRLGAITVATTFEGEPVAAEQLGAAGSMAALLTDALKPNLVQTLEGRPALVHCGPFANIAHGNNSVLADKLGLKLGDYVVTESGFGADMGFEKFVDIVCRGSGLAPDAVVLVATTQALKHHGGDPEGGLPAIERGAENLEANMRIVREFGLDPVVAVNRFPGDDPLEVDAVCRLALELGAFAAELNDGYERGGPGAVRLAEVVTEAVSRPAHVRPSIRSASRSRPRSRPSRRAPTEPRGSSSRRRRPHRRTGSPTPISARCPSASRRHTSRSRTTPRSAVRPRASRCRCASSGLTRAPAGSSRSAARCRRCPASRRSLRRCGSMSTQTAASSGSADLLQAGRRVRRRCAVPALVVCLAAAHGTFLRPDDVGRRGGQVRPGAQLPNRIVARRGIGKERQVGDDRDAGRRGNQEQGDDRSLHAANASSRRSTPTSAGRFAATAATSLSSSAQ
jgi:formate--tetrahydrofolate ligase